MPPPVQGSLAAPSAEDSSSESEKLDRTISVRPTDHLEGNHARTPSKVAGLQPLPLALFRPTVINLSVFSVAMCVVSLCVGVTPGGAMIWVCWKQFSMLLDSLYYCMMIDSDG